ncbi:MAG TPA: phosphatase PAP2 family protein [Pirellulales bacterium]
MQLQSGTELKSDRPRVVLHSTLRQADLMVPLERGGWKHMRIVPVFLAFFGFAALYVDVPIARWFGAHNPIGIKKLFELSEAFGHGLGIAIILLAVWVLAPDRRVRVPRLIACTYLAGLAAISLKLILARHRPYQTPLDSVHPPFGTFGNWLPWFTSSSAWESFPSGHAAAAIGLALGLSWLLPRGRWMFASLVLLVALQRMASGYHYLSDTLWGAAIGWVIATSFLPGGRASRWFDRLEGQLRTDS